MPLLFKNDLIVFLLTYKLIWIVPYFIFPQDVYLLLPGKWTGTTCDLLCEAHTQTFIKGDGIWS